MMITNNLRRFLPCLIALVLCLPVKGMAQVANELPDSILYSLEMYRETFNAYKAKKDNGLKTSVDSSLLILSYYPWCTVFDSRAVHRVSVYDDGIHILKDLIKTTNDTIQREYYFEELMNVYDVWYEYADTINKRMDVPFSKTLILSEKIRSYEELMPIMYNLWWDSISVIEGDTLKTETIQDNILTPEVCRLYDYMKTALYSQESKEDIYYEIPYLYFRLSHARLRADQKLYSEQYAIDFDSVDIRYDFLKTLDLGGAPSNNISALHKTIAKMFDDASGILVINSSGNWHEKEEAFRNQLYEKLDLWDLGIEEPDPQFLNRVIRGIGTDSSDVYVEALECYVRFLVPSGGTVSEDNLDDYKAKRKLLYNAYSNRARYDDAVSILREIISVERNDIAKAEYYYLLGYSLKMQGKSPIFEYKRAVKSNPKFGNALYELAVEYSKCSFTGDKTKDRIKYFLCLDLLQKAKECIETNAGDPNLRKYNSTSLLTAIDGTIKAFRQNVPEPADLHMLGIKPGTRFNFPKGTYMDGESTVIR